MRNTSRALGRMAAALSLATMLTLTACFGQGAQTPVESDPTDQTIVSDRTESEAEQSDEAAIEELVGATQALFADPTPENLAQAGIASGDGSESGYGTYDDQLAYYHNLSLEIASTNVEGDSATVELDVTNADFEKAAELAQQDSAAWREENGGADAGSKFTEFYNERLMGGDVETKTVRCALTCSRQADGSWAWDELPGSNQAFVAALSGVELPG